MNSLIGKPVSRIDGFAKVTGEAKYAGDYTLQNLAHAVIFESQIAYGTIKSFDLTQARQVAGVVDIITHENAPKIQKPKSQSAGGSRGENSLPLQDDEVRYNGQFIGVVVAETLEAAVQAAHLVKVNYKEKKAALSIDNLRLNSYEVKKVEGMGKISGKRGDSKKAFKNADVKLSATYSTPIENHNPMEPSAILIEFRGDELFAYDATQGVWTSADILGQAFKTKKTHVIAKYIGGGFGCKGSVWNHQFLAALAAKKLNRPIKLCLSRPQMFTGVGHRSATLQEINLGARNDGTLDAIEHTVYNNTAVDKEFSERSAVSTRMLYQCENIKAEHRLVKLNYQVPTFMRAPGEASGSAAMECAMDEMAEKLAMDPMQFRLKNYAEKDQQAKKPYSSKSLKECYEKGAAHFAWNRRNMKPRTKKEGNDWIGYGMATATYPANRFGTKASVEISSDGKVKVRCATQDIGTGSWTIFSQIAAQAFNVPIENVDLDIGDSKFPRAGVSGGSSTASSAGSAIQKACDKIKIELAKLQVEKNQEQSFASILNAAKKDKLVAEGEVKVERGETDKFSTHSFGAQFAEVRVNELTGEIRVTKMTGAFACGRILNEKTARSQYMGGMIFGIGQCLMEESVPDLLTGRITNRDLASYHFPVNADVPQLDVLMVEEKDEEVNVIGTKGIGEIGIVGAAAAIANAVYNATGIRIREFPLTPDKMINAMS